jgi:hypothetical protein
MRGHCASGCWWRWCTSATWLGGMAVAVLAFGIQAAALAFGPLALVQPLVATEVLFALPMIAHRNRLPLMRKGIIGGLGVVSGLAIFVAVSPPPGGVSVPGLAAWAPALAGIAALTVLSASVGLRRRGTARVIWLAAATAVIYALVNAVTKSSAGLLMHRGVGVLATWEPYTLMQPSPRSAGALRPPARRRRPAWTKQSGLPWTRNILMFGLPGRIVAGGGHAVRCYGAGICWCCGAASCDGRVQR